MSIQAPVVIYTTRFCPFCIRAKQLLDKKDVVYEEIPVDNDNARRHEMTQRAGRSTVPQIWVGDTHIGGCDQLYASERDGMLDQLLSSTA
ncbi:glutaredoxin 3 [Luminiphilus syltensis NOR5-1B]|uniref:Glutaredoxin n=1 Tax=Luminiphilus syltensis NOR5-1B TaxID=565045 RepID=B8KUP6_9GAMM|nr:glutaredoxin 3 [Luminiphilus syltensis]EED35175.1 glutaredoxin 3 [Luminiphilus syltensis NOR5-1B]